MRTAVKTLRLQRKKNTIEHFVIFEKEGFLKKKLKRISHFSSLF
jgi:hypothetical protein